MRIVSNRPWLIHANYMTGTLLKIKTSHVLRTCYRIEVALGKCQRWHTSVLKENGTKWYWI